MSPQKGDSQKQKGTPTSSETIRVNMEKDAVAARSSLSLEELWAELSVAEAVVVAFGPTPEQLREEVAEAERMTKENGMPVKSAKVIQVLQHRWKLRTSSQCMAPRSAAYGFEEIDGPTIELAIHFQVRVCAACTAM